MLCWKKHSSEEQTEQNNKTNVPLQVRSPFYVRKRSMLRKAECGPVSRAFPFISRKQRKSENQRKMKASMTLEAAFTLSLLIFASVSLMLPAKIMLKILLQKEKLRRIFQMTESKLQQKDIRCLLLSMQQLHAAESVSESGIKFSREKN